MFAGGSVFSESLMRRRLLWCCKGGRGSLRFRAFSFVIQLELDSSSLKIVHGDGFEVARGVPVKS